MSVNECVAIVLEAFRAVEQRDEERLLELFHPEVEFHWTPSLPFGGSSRGGVRDRPGPSWSEVSVVFCGNYDKRQSLSWGQRLAHTEVFH